MARLAVCGTPWLVLLGVVCFYRFSCFPATCPKHCATTHWTGCTCNKPLLTITLLKGRPYLPVLTSPGSGASSSPLSSIVRPPAVAVTSKHDERLMFRHRYLYIGSRSRKGACLALVKACVPCRDLYAWISPSCGACGPLVCLYPCENVYDASCAYRHLGPCSYACAPGLVRQNCWSSAGACPSHRHLLAEQALVNASDRSV